MPDLSAERTPGRNPGIRHGAHRRRDILTALLAADGEIALPAFRKIEHEGSIGEQKAKISTILTSRFTPTRLPRS